MSSEAMKGRMVRAVTWVVLGALALGLIFISAVRMAQRRVASNEMERKQEAKREEWAGQELIPIGEYEQVCAELRAGDSMRGLDGGEERVEALVRALGSILVAYSQGDVDHYQRFRFPIEPTLANSGWDPDGMAFYGLLAEELKIDFEGMSYAVSNRTLMVSVFRNADRITRAAPGALGTRILTSYSPRTLRAELALEPLPVTSMMEWAREEMVKAVTRVNSVVGYRFEDEAAAMAGTWVARVRILCGTTLQTPVFPFYLKLLWYPEAGQFVATEWVVPLPPTEIPDLLF
ncbi:MAG: hypothetical protein KF833_21605 [Verrucomicrobiae bacterium]|nr:hypothetical protein [Verrucomicrobiae bacterium]